MSSELIFGLFCLVFVVGTFWLSAVFEGRRRDREQKTQQVVEETSDPRAVVSGAGVGAVTSLVVHQNALMGTAYFDSFDASIFL